MEGTPVHHAGDRNMENAVHGATNEQELISPKSMVNAILGNIGLPDAKQTRTTRTTMDVTAWPLVSISLSLKLETPELTLAYECVQVVLRIFFVANSLDCGLVS
ncbi:uncharacterized protein LOC119347284 [Triticum dicoccoides]|uniref:uncharacterized protein LOC119347284 n=1 Tax=Triticum dicoccoides TaxID=85692 RepID=UPI00188E7616|nr:uncharacterized protein LOC119347284 [Triticum dicoccoides]